MASITGLRAITRPEDVWEKRATRVSDVENRSGPTDAELTKIRGVGWATVAIAVVAAIVVLFALSFEASYRQERREIDRQLQGSGTYPVASATSASGVVLAGPARPQIR